MKTLKTALLSVALMAATSAGAYKTAGDGTTYSLETLSAIEDANIYRYVDEDDGEVIYQIYDSDTIAAGDRFVMDDGVTVQFDDDVQLVIEGEADFNLTKGSLFDSAYDDADYVRPVGIYVNSMQAELTFANCQFYYVGLRASAASRVTVSHCDFYNNNGAIGQAALIMSTGDAAFSIDGCTFEGNAKAAISSAANYFTPVSITNCTFRRNGQNNGNTPQLNLTVSEQVSIEGCTIEGDPTKTMVGGIGISNFYALDGTHVTIRNCDIRDNRYGIGLTGTSDIRIENNRLVDNCHETNPMNGGSGISLYDPYRNTTAVIAGNHIEGSLWGVTVIGCKDVNLGQPTATDIQSPGGNTFKDNGNGGQLYDLYNNSDLTIYAQNNTWNVSEQTEAQIETVIFHKNDDARLGQVIFMPAAGTTDGISTATAEPAENGRSYTTGGRQASRTARHSLMISNGKKTIR
ncbi:MAG: right-handed parallel beta-helix repeat-containing protein [Prevotella sp.]|nr:right-handed parallel beta-helix repeat-containing protein [Prevotella sp.]